LSCAHVHSKYAGTFDPTLPQNRWPGRKPNDWIPANRETNFPKCKIEVSEKETAPSQDQEGDCVENNEEENGCVAFFLPKWHILNTNEMLLNITNDFNWCKEHKNWTTDQWSRVLFKDESRFSTSNSQGVLFLERSGHGFIPVTSRERHHYGGPGVLVWGGIMLNGRTKLHIFDRGSVIGDRYCEEVLLPHVRLFQVPLAPDFIFMDDNARPHRTLAVEELLESEDITRIDWPGVLPV
ncbi:transposable element Tcb2 transposase, partial [Trichonephila clavipes]